MSAFTDSYSGENAIGYTSPAEMTTTGNGSGSGSGNAVKNAWNWASKAAGSFFDLAWSLPGELAKASADVSERAQTAYGSAYRTGQESAQTQTTGLAGLLTGSTAPILYILIGVIVVLAVTKK